MLVREIGGAGQTEVGLILFELSAHTSECVSCIPRRVVLVELNPFRSYAIQHRSCERSRQVAKRAGLDPSRQRLPAHLDVHHLVRGVPTLLSNLRASDFLFSAPELRPDVLTVRPARDGAQEATGLGEIQESRLPHPRLRAEVRGLRVRGCAGVAGEGGRVRLGRGCGGRR